MATRTKLSGAGGVWGGKGTGRLSLGSGDRVEVRPPFIPNRLGLGTGGRLGVRSPSVPSGGEV